VALVLAAVGDLSGSGGTERQFSDLFIYLQRHRPGRVTLVTTAAAIEQLRTTGRLQPTDDVLALPIGRSGPRGRLGVLRLTLALIAATLRHRWDIVHLCQPTPVYVPYAALITRLPRSLRPRVALTVVDCTLAHRWFDPSSSSDVYEAQVVAAHRMYAKWTRLDGVYSWYRAFVDLARNARLFSNAALTAARYCFTDPGRFTPAPAKAPVVIFAGRLSEQKRPLLFVEMVGELMKAEPSLARGWSFVMYGRGPLEAAVRQRIADLGLEQAITLTHAPDLAPVFARSRVFVSTQAFENFTSLAMLEAMAAGNAVIAEDVGQTGEFVRDGHNGFVFTGAAPAALAAALARYLRAPQDHDRMAGASRAIATEVHTIEHFADDIAAFWAAVARA
jgi:glycosyltransferase involved in cell wall biosynthesis